MIEIIPSGDSIIILKDLKNLQSSIISKEIEKLNLSEIEDIISLKNSIGIIFNPYKIKSNRIIKKIQGLIKDNKIGNLLSMESSFGEDILTKKKLFFFFHKKK